MRQAGIKWNVTPLFRRSSNFVFFASLYCSCIGFNALLALPTKEGGNKGIKSKKGAIKWCKKKQNTLLNKLWPLLDLRAELDLRSTKNIQVIRSLSISDSRIKQTKWLLVIEQIKIKRSYLLFKLLECFITIYICKPSFRKIREIKRLKIFWLVFT